MNFSRFLSRSLFEVRMFSLKEMWRISSFFSCSQQNSRAGPSLHGVKLTCQRKKQMPQREVKVAVRHSGSGIPKAMCSSLASAT